MIQSVAVYLKKTNKLLDIPFFHFCLNRIPDIDSQYMCLFPFEVH